MNSYDPYGNRPPQQNPYSHPQWKDPRAMPPQSCFPVGAPGYPPPNAPFSQPLRPVQPTRRDVPRKRRGFWASVLPWRGDTFGEVFRKFIFILAFFAFCFCGYLLYIQYVSPLLQNNQLLETQRSNYYGSEINEAEEIDDLDVRIIQPKFLKLYQENQDIVGWIQIDNTLVDYPVYQSSSEDPEYYLNRTAKGEHSAYGSIFMDSRIDITDYRNTILYGHHMADGSMFAQITRFKNLDFYKKTPTFTFDSIYENSEWKIFSVFIANTKSEHGDPFYYIRTDFKDDNDYMSFVTQLRIRSILDIPVDVRADDQILLLSTCSYEFDEFRTVLCARKVRPGESAKVDVSLAKAASNPLYPDIWYRKFGGTPPEIPEYAYGE